MTFTITSNEKINSVKIHESIINGEKIIHDIEIDFTPSEIWSDLEFWLNDSTSGTFIDYAKMNLSKRNKMQFSK